MWMSRRLPQCSSCSPGEPSAVYAPHCHYCHEAGQAGCQAAPLRWCFAHIYDPEGALATLPTVMSVWLGVHFGRALRAEGLANRPKHILLHWAACASVLMLLGIILHFWGGLPMSKQLWSTSYLCFMAGSCGTALLLTYAMLDAGAAAPPAIAPWRRRARAAAAPLELLGMNASTPWKLGSNPAATITAIPPPPPPLEQSSSSSGTAPPRRCSTLSTGRRPRRPAPTRPSPTPRAARSSAHAAGCTRRRSAGSRPRRASSCTCCSSCSASSWARGPAGGGATSGRYEPRCSSARRPGVYSKPYYVCARAVRGPERRSPAACR